MTIPVVHFRFGGAESTAAGMGRPYTVVYDGACKVCGRLVKLLNAWDVKNEMEVIPFQNTSVLDRFPWIPSEAYAEAMQLIGPGGRTWQGGEAIEQPHVLAEQAVARIVERPATHQAEPLAWRTAVQEG